MAGSSFGTLYKVTTWGESHGKAVGAVIDGVPAGLELGEQDIQPFLDRRRPGRNRFATARQEMDLVEILSGVFEGRTTGTPVSLLVRNTDQRSRDYSGIASYYRPGHADQTYDLKYGFRDYRGGGRSSGRETIGRTAAGAVASKILSTLGIEFHTYVSSAGPVVLTEDPLDFSYVSESVLCMPDPESEKRAAAYLDECIKAQTSAGGTVTCIVNSLPAGLGEPVFDKLDAVLAHAIFSIGAVKAVEIGSGTQAALMTGDEHNDAWRMSEDGIPEKTGNHAGGVLGGISDGSPLRIRVSFKPTPSIAQPQQALFASGQIGEVKIGGRHDPFIPARACVVVESMTAITLLDLLMQNMTSRMDSLRRFYGENH